MNHIGNIGGTLEKRTEIKAFPTSAEPEPIHNFRNRRTTDRLIIISIHLAVVIGIFITDISRLHLLERMIGDSVNQCPVRLKVFLLEQADRFQSIIRVQRISGTRTGGLFHRLGFVILQYLVTAESEVAP